MWRVPRSTVYARHAAVGPAPVSARKRGPRTALDDAALVLTIRAVRTASPFTGEGHRKVRARLAAQGVRAGKARVLRLMRERRLLAPVRTGPPNGDRAHAGTIIPEGTNELWGTDATRFYTRRDGWCWFFGAVDHFVGDVVGWHVAKKGDRWAALEPIRQGVSAHCGAYQPKVALGVGLRMDWGPQYTAHQFLGELAWLGIRPSPSYVGKPECKGLDSYCTSCAA
jgi:putative transposase